MRLRRSFLAWRCAFKLSALVVLLPSSCLRRCHSLCCLVRLCCYARVGPSDAALSCAIDARSFTARWRRGRSLAAADARIAHWPRRFLVRSSLIHDVLRVVLARVGLRAAALRCEQQHSKEWKEGLPHQCEELPPSSLKHSRGRHSCRSAFSKQMGSDAASLSICTLRSRFLGYGFCGAGAETRPVCS